MPRARSTDAIRPRPMSLDVYRAPTSVPLTDSLEIFERQLRRSFAAGVEREYISYPPAQPVAGQFENAIFHLVIRTTGLVGGIPTVKIIFEDSSDGNNWAILITYTEAGPSDGTYRYQAPTPFGGFLRVRLLISGAGGIGLVLCRGVLSVRRSPRRWPFNYGGLPGGVLPKLLPAPPTRGILRCQCGGTCATCAADTTPCGCS